MTDLPILIIAILVLWPLDIITVAARTGLVLASRPRLNAAQSEGDDRTTHLLELLDRQTAARQSLHLTVVILRVLLAGAYLLALSAALPELGVAATLLLMAAGGLLLWLSEFITEQRVSLHPERWALRFSFYIRLLTSILSPVIRLASAAIGESEERSEVANAVTEDELKTLVDASQREGVLEQDEREMIFSIFRFGDTLAREIMIPRIDVLALSDTTPIGEAIDTLLASGFSRVPVFVGTIDNIRGLLYVKDLLRALHEGNQDKKLEEILREAYFIPETKKVNELLEELQNQRIHMAIVVDEYGGMAGVVTLEDIVEEIIGEIQDEYDQSEELLYHRVDETEYIFHGRIDLDDFNVFMHSELPGDDADTLGGYIYSQMGRVPRSGESLQTEDLKLTVEQVSGRRIRRVRAQRMSDEAEEELSAPPPE
ncbi:MAG: hemolysin family protein [Anaerolineales bacterium]|nr:hemolysin family protein [Anaerolineales bacterium]